MVEIMHVCGTIHMKYDSSKINMKLYTTSRIIFQSNLQSN